MKLSTFIQETIFEIGLGIHAAKIRSKDIIAVAPGAMGGADVTEKSYVDFDVTVIVKDSSKTSRDGKAGASGKIEVARVFSVGVDASANSDGEMASEIEHTQRISFKVPVWFNGHFRSDANIENDRQYVERLLEENESE